MHSLEGFNVHPGQLSVSFLPLSHVTARHADLALLYHGVTLAYCPFFEQSAQALLEVLPTILSRTACVRKDLQPGGTESQEISEAGNLSLGSIGGPRTIS